MPEALYERNRFDGPTVDVPDWELIARLVDLLNPYTVGFGFGLLVQFRDNRGTYSSADPAELIAAMEARGEQPESAIAMLSGTEQTGTSRTVEIHMRHEGRSSFSVSSGDEAIAEHICARATRLFEQAGARREERLALGQPLPKPPATGGEASPAAAPSSAPSPTSAAAAAPAVAETERSPRWLHQPNPWVLVIVGGIIAAVVGGVILVLIFG